MAKPEPIQKVEVSSWASEAASQETASLTCKKGDLLVVRAVMEGETGLNDTLAISGGGLTWTAPENGEVKVNEYTYIRVWHAVATEDATFKVKVTKTGDAAFDYGAMVRVWRKASGIGAVAKVNASGAPSLDITTKEEHSAIECIVGDWNAVDGSGANHEFRTGAGAATEDLYFRDASAYTVYAWYHADAGAAGKVTVGLNKPTGQKYSMVAIEIKGEAGDVTISVPAATATLSAPAPTPVISLAGAAAVASATASPPTPAASIAAPAAAVAAAASPPVPQVAVAAPSAQALGSAPAPVLAVVMSIPPALVSASAMAPTVVIEEATGPPAIDLPTTAVVSAHQAAASIEAIISTATIKVHASAADVANHAAGAAVAASRSTAEVDVLRSSADIEPYLAGAAVKG